MPIARFQRSGESEMGIVAGDAIHVISPEWLSTLPDIHRLGAAAVVGSGVPLNRLPLQGTVYDVSQVSLLAPVPIPGSILCLAGNYKAHVDEDGLDVSAVPNIFARLPGSVIDPFAQIPLTGADPAMDYEGELGVVIARTTRRIRPADAYEYVAGYVVANDVSARTWQLRVSQWTIGKSFDGTCPLGPWLVTTEELADPGGLTITTRLNGETVQDSSTGHMLYAVDEIVAFIASVVTLYAGDVILTGTPAGVGHAKDPPCYLRAGDLVEVDIAGVGAIANLVVEQV